MLLGLSRLRAVFAAPPACTGCGGPSGDDAMAAPDGGPGQVCPRCWALGTTPPPATPEALALDPADLTPADAYAIDAPARADYARAMARLDGEE